MELDLTCESCSIKLSQFVTDPFKNEIDMHHVADVLDWKHYRRTLCVPCQIAENQA
jgi:hypothetical protein